MSRIVDMGDESTDERMDAQYRGYDSTFAATDRIGKKRNEDKEEGKFLQNQSLIRKINLQH